MRLKKMTLTGAKIHRIIVLNLQNEMNPTKLQTGYIEKSRWKTESKLQNLSLTLIYSGCSNVNSDELKRP